MEIRNIHEHASWLASYQNSIQTKALILCQKKKIEQLTDILEKVKMDLELVDDPRIESDANVLASIKTLVTEIEEVEYTEDYFKWIG